MLQEFSQEYAKNSNELNTTGFWEPLKILSPLHSEPNPAFLEVDVKSGL